MSKRLRYWIQGGIDSRLTKDEVIEALSRLGFFHFSVAVESEEYEKETEFDKVITELKGVDEK